MNRPNPPSEREPLVLSDDCRGPDTFPQWLIDHYDRLHAAAFRVARLRLPSSDAEDAVQEALSALYQAVVVRGDELRDPERWVAVVAARRATSIWRDRLPEQPAAEGDIGGFLAGQEDDDPPDEDVLAVRLLLRKAMATMTPAEQLAFYLHHVEDWTLAEIAAVSSTPVNTIKTQLSRARAKARRVFTEGET